MWEKIRDERDCRERIGRVQIRRVASASLTTHFTDSDLDWKLNDDTTAQVRNLFKIAHFERISPPTNQNQRFSIRHPHHGAPVDLAYWCCPLGSASPVRSRLCSGPDLLTRPWISSAARL
jgi:hypothetical protein